MYVVFRDFLIKVNNNLLCILYVIFYIFVKKVIINWNCNFMFFYVKKECIISVYTLNWEEGN